MAEWYVRQESETNPDFGSIPEKRSVEELLEKGMVLIDKPFGPTSNQVSTWIKEELDLKKTGHFGTLDPNATGVLPVGLNSGTRINDALAKADKEYIFEAETEEAKDKQEVKEALKSFRGVNKQVPPEKSAVKREEREREVYDIELLEVEDRKILGRVECESGFYVRVLIDQLGEKLDTEASMKELRRTREGDITEDETSTLQDVVDAYHFYNEGREKEIREVLHPIEKGIQHLKKIAVKDSAVNAVANGADLGSTGISKLQDGIKEDDMVAVITLKGELVALAEARMTSEQMYSAEGTAAELQSVHMDPETYPKRWKQ
ncbi:RNA-guided pseudouridylation complex pseudouridine synthase subunit Cbf5 [Candidatus Nanosalina sp. VS9-1]|uniref:RNA-guided pseudouridylation complex pseudouridine synthase subunit Cbf5 n=1 Tax=Candidatus Nanosalina sp. VS9-1 TaxID=3388566 RepID=UPI0039E05349